MLLGDAFNETEYLNSTKPFCANVNMSVSWSARIIKSLTFLSFFFTMSDVNEHSNPLVFL